MAATTIVILKKYSSNWRTKSRRTLSLLVHNCLSFADSDQMYLYFNSVFGI